ncbi:MAG: glutamate--tRNA ligase [Clostridia bacterium]|nr:glutamate--tRNA ligase [Clostridia bacterium]
MPKIRTRFAPSPTGAIHLGNMRTALFNYLFARSNANAEFVLRIEDTDLKRSSGEYEQCIYDELNWLGIDWDEGPDKGGQYGPYRQSERLELYKQYAKQLIDSGYAYYCYCTPEEVEQDKKLSVQKGGIPKYSGRCRNLSPGQIEEYKKRGRKPIIRFKVPEDQVIVFEDMIKGKITMKADTLGGDMVIFKSDGMPTYNFAVVVDDALMEITHVIRGEDHLSNTPKQILIYKALGFDIPMFAHAPLILGPDRTKLSKRHGNTFVGQYREKGYLPEALFNYLSLLSWSPEGEQELFIKEEIISQFAMNRVSKSNPVFDIKKLNWINAHYIKESSADRITKLAIPRLVEKGYVKQPVDESMYNWIKKAVISVKDSLSYIDQIDQELKIYFQQEVEMDKQAKEVLSADHVPMLLETLKKKIQEADIIDQEFSRQLFKILRKETGVKGKGLYMPIRVALTGQTHGPELYEIFDILGREKILNRIDLILKDVV